MNDFEHHLVEEFRAGRLSRRELLRRATVAGLSLAAADTLVNAAGARAASGLKTTAASVAGRSGGTLRVGVIAPTAAVDPVTLTSQGALTVAQCSLEYLCFPRPDYSLEPKLATSWKAENPRTWTFVIRQGVTWQDGSPFTVDDVVYTFDLLTNPKENSAALSAFQGILSTGNIEKVNSTTVRFHLDRPYVNFPYLVSAFTYNSFVLPKNYQVGSFTKGGIGTGPYILKDFNPLVSAQFTKNPHYWAKGLPYADAIDVQFYTDTPPLVFALQGNAIDIVPFLVYEGSQPLFKDPSVTVLTNPSSAYEEVAMRTDTAPFSNLKFRQAIAWCVDRPALVQGLLGGNGQIGNDHAFAPIFSVSPTDIPQRKQDYAMAKRLLAEAGYARGVQIQLTTGQLYELPEYVVYLQQQLKPVGIDVKPNVENLDVWYGSGANQPWLEVPFGIPNWDPRGVPSQTITPAYLCHSVWDSSKYCNPKFDTLIHQLDAELDIQKQKALAKAAALIMHDDTPAVIAYWLKDLRAITKNVHNVAPGPSTSLDPSAIWLSA